MRIKSTVLVLALVSLGIAATAGVAAGQSGANACEFPYDSDDQLRDTVTTTGVDEKPETIVTGAPSVTQIVWEMGLQDRVVGVSNPENVGYLNGVRGKTDVGSAVNSSTFSFESDFPVNVGEANNGNPPDLLIGELNVFGLESGLDPFSDVYDYHWFEAGSSFGEIENTVRDVGRMTGECEASENVIDEFRGDIREVESTVAGRDPVSVLYTTPTDGGAFVPGNGTFIHDMITTAGGKNIYAEVGIEGFKPIEDETSVAAVLGQNPDWIVVLDTDPTVPRNDLYNATTAVQEDQILVVDADLIQQSGPRVTTPLKRMARSFHPEAFGPTDNDGPSYTEPFTGDVGETTTATLSAVGEVSVAEFDSGPVESVEVGVATEGDVSVSVTETGDAPGKALKRVTIEVPEEARGAEGTVRFNIDSETLEEAGLPSEDLVVVKDEGGWIPLDTTAIEAETGTRLIAGTPGYSDFAVVASTEPVVSVDASVDDGVVRLSAADSYDEYGEITRYNWTVDGASYEGESIDVESDGGEATLVVTNDAGLSNETTVEFSVDSAEETVDEQVQDGNETEADGTEEETDEVESDEEGGNETSGDSGGEGLPGFTAVAALVAVVAAAVVSRR
jgi:iron complex transport system substrate-binding protein